MPSIKKTTKILFVTGEAFPLMKTGGLGDVSGSLPPALRALGCDVRLLMPAYRDAKARLVNPRVVARLHFPRLDAPVAVLEGELPNTGVPVWLVDFPPAYDRAGNPYMDPHGQPWPDNAARFALLARVARAIALGQALPGWQPDIVHCHDWQTGLIPALLAHEARRPATIFTIHNLAYQGLFPYETLQALGLPASWWSSDALEFYGQLSFMKGGLVFSDWITTVSPTYAREIQQPEQGYGLDGLLRHRADRLIGILNGIDDAIWNPARDAHIATTYTAKQITKKRGNKTALQKELSLARESDVLLIGMVGRLVWQKGMDIVIDALPQLMRQNIQLVTLGSGDATLERALRSHAAAYPGKCAAVIGYDEGLAHRIIAGSDAFLMPSRFEPCGLSQLYALRYGTVPIVHRVGGLIDTVTDATPATLAAKTTTGVVFDRADATSLVDAVTRTMDLRERPRTWAQLIATAMHQDNGWRHSAKEYLALYRSALT